MPRALETERQLFADYLERRGLKMTRERASLFDEVFASHQHQDAEDLVARLKERGEKTSRATVYRTLELLHACGLVGRVRLNEEKYRYEPLRIGEHHDHLICQSCGTVVEFVEPRIERLQDAICRVHGFLPMTHTHQIRGLCTRCRKGAPGRRPAGPEAAPTAPIVRSVPSSGGRRRPVRR